MVLRDLNDDSDRLTTGLGRFAAETVYTDGNSPDYTTGGGGGAVYTDYVDVTPIRETLDQTVAQPVVEVIPRVIAPEIKQTLQLPQFDFTTGVASCTDCTTANATDVLKTSSAASLTTSAVNTKVTPLPEGPKQINWLLIAAAAGIAYFTLKGDTKPGLGNVPEGPEPVQTEQPLGRPPRKPAPKLKHVDSFKIK